MNDRMTEIKNRLALVSVGEWEGYIDKEGQLVIEIHDPKTTAIIWCGDMEVCTGQDLDNHDFLSNARDDMLYLVSVIEDLSLQTQKEKDNA
jgi:hypothetical protein